MNQPATVQRAHAPGTEPGALHFSKDGVTVWEIQKGGYRKKLPPGVALRCFEAHRNDAPITSVDFDAWMRDEEVN